MTQMKCETSNSDYSTDWKMPQGKDGVLYVLQNAESVALPLTNTNYAGYEVDYQEGYFEFANIRIHGLMRVNSKVVEVFSQVMLEPVDPAKIGLSWKFLNTQSALDNGAADSGVELVGMDAATAAPQRDPVAAYGVTSFWSHNGSVMGMVEDAQTRKFIYLKPRSKLKKIGIETGTLLFKGFLPHGSRSIDGYSSSFSTECGTYFYDVSGSISANERRIVLKGGAPRFNSRCQQSGTRRDTLVFDYLGSVESTTLEKVASRVK